MCSLQLKTLFGLLADSLVIGTGRREVRKFFLVHWESVWKSISESALERARVLKRQRKVFRKVGVFEVVAEDFRHLPEWPLCTFNKFKFDDSRLPFFCIFVHLRFLRMPPPSTLRRPTGARANLAQDQGSPEIAPLCLLVCVTFHLQRETKRIAQCVFNRSL